MSSPANAAPHYPSTGRLPGVSATLAGAHKDEYLAYIRSPWWVARKAAIVLHRGYKCERCNSTRQLELHHKTYERLTRELPDDVELLCRNCHLREHGLEIHERLWGLQPLDYAGVLEEIQCRT